jgi:protein gp37
MAENTKIEWATHTFNPWWGCTRISRACDNCYAADLRLANHTSGDASA